MKNKTYEILAPAGNAEALAAAVNNGADAVYLGLDKFNARMKAENFTSENLGDYVSYCRLFGVKVYVAVNTSLKNDEIAQAEQMICAAYDSGADGVIVTDLALIGFASAFPKPFEVAASTQLNAHDGYGARLLKHAGATTVVAARESSYGEIAEIAGSGVRTECFIQGALCVCQSGQCLFSSMVGGNSGNRGLCAQPCRKKYAAYSREGNKLNEGYLLSAKDLCGLGFAEKLRDIGVSVFKIEGRNRRAEYSGAASDVYSRLFRGESASANADKEILSEMFNRGGFLTDRYLKGLNDGIVFPDVQGHIGVYVGKVRGDGFDSAVDITKGDGLKVFYRGREVGHGTAAASGKGFVRAAFSDGVFDGCEVRRTTSCALNEKILSVKRKLDVKAEFAARAGEASCLKLICGDTVYVCKSDDMVSEASGEGTTAEDIARQLQKTGDSYFNITDIVVDIGKIFMRKAQINALRRKALQKLYEQLLSDTAIKRKPFLPQSTVKVREQKYSGGALMAVCRTPDEAAAAKKEGADYIVCKPEIITPATLSAFPQFKWYLDAPSFADNGFIKEVLSSVPCAGVAAHNIGAVGMARENGIPYIAASGLNIMNDGMADFFSDADAFVYSEELTVNEINSFGNKNGFIYCDGEITLMKVVHCPFKLNGAADCEHCTVKNGLKYVDEKGNTFYFKRRKDKRCTFELVNGLKLSAAGKLTTVGRYCVDYDQAVLAHYKALNEGIDDGYAERRPYTKGRLFSKIN